MSIIKISDGLLTIQAKLLTGALGDHQPKQESEYCGENHTDPVATHDLELLLASAAHLRVCFNTYTIIICFIILALLPRLCLSVM